MNYLFSNYPWLNRLAETVDLVFKLCLILGLGFPIMALTVGGGLFVFQNYGWFAGWFVEGLLVVTASIVMNEFTKVLD